LGKDGHPIGKKWAHHWAKMGTPLEKNGHTIGQKWADHWANMGEFSVHLGSEGRFSRGTPPGGGVGRAKSRAKTGREPSWARDRPGGSSGGRVTPPPGGVNQLFSED
jgi:hypothetical protein